MVGIDTLKIASDKVANKSAVATGEFIGNKIAEEIVKVKSILEASSRNVEEIIIPLEQRKKICNELRHVL